MRGEWGGDGAPATPRVVVFVLLFTLLADTAPAAEASSTWQQFVAAKQNQTAPPVPDFSYTGYHYFARPIPDVSHTVFDVTDYGAVADDDLSDQGAIERAIAAAKANGSGVVFFPPGEFLVNTDTDAKKPIAIGGSNIVLRGSGSRAGGTIIRTVNSLVPGGGGWISPFMFSFKPHSINPRVLTTVTESAARETFWITVADATELTVGQWITLYMTSTDAIEEFLDPYSPPGENYFWKPLFDEGININEKHRIAEIDGNRIRLAEPLRAALNPEYGWDVRSYPLLEEVGIEDLSLHGTFLEKFRHNINALHYGGYSLLELARCVNSWVRRVSLVNTVRGLQINNSAGISVHSVTIAGNQGHVAMGVLRSSNVWVGLSEDLADQYHGVGPANTANGTVFYRFDMSPGQPIDIHRTQPSHATLYDRVSNGRLNGSSGNNIPTNHLRHLVFWNFKHGGKNIHYDFWQPRLWFVLPVIVGLHGEPATFETDTVGVLESNGAPVSPDSLLEAQLALRLGAVPAWLATLRTDWETLRSESLPAYLSPPPPPAVELSASALTVAEGQSTTYTAALVSRPFGKVTLTPSGYVDTAVLVAPATLTFTADNWAVPQTFTVSVKEDEDDVTHPPVPIEHRAAWGGYDAVVAGTVVVTITEAESPEVSGPGSPAVSEGRERQVATYTATNPANGSLEWSVSGPDAAAFTIGRTTGVLDFAAPPDHEARSPAEYAVTVEASDGTRSGELAVAVRVLDAPGQVSLSAAAPQVGSPLTARLHDPDGIASDPPPVWCWERSLSDTFPPTDTHAVDCGPATTDTYIPGATDLGHYLRATVAYTDGAGTPKREAAASPPTEEVSIQQRRSPSPGGGGGGGGGSRGRSGPACADDRHGNSAPQATVVPLATETGGAICPAADVDYLTVLAPGPGLLFVDTTGSVTIRGTLWQDAVILASGLTRGRRQDARLGARVQAGAVVVALHGQGGATGPYAVAVTFVRGALENPGQHSFQSGVGVLSGWVCEADTVEVAVADLPVQVAGYGTQRVDTRGVCGDTDNGFGLLFNWNLLGDGEHEVVAWVDGVELGRAAATVTTLGEEFVRGVAGECIVADFPSPGETVELVWQQNQQNFVLADGPTPTGVTTRTGTPGVGRLENPGPNALQSGIGVISGWVCEAEGVEVELGPSGRRVAVYGTERVDTLDACGDTDNGFGLLFNWNLLGDGEHEVVAWVDDTELARTTVRVTTLGEEFVRGIEGACTVEDFPAPGETLTLKWQQNQQNFVVTGVE